MGIHVKKDIQLKHYESIFGFLPMDTNVLGFVAVTFNVAVGPYTVCSARNF